MTTTTITLDEPTQRRLEELAAVRGVTPEEIIREAVEKELKPLQQRPRSKSIGMGASGQTDLARRISDETPELAEPGVRRKNMPRSIGIAESGYTDTSELASKPLFKLDCSDLV